MVCELCGGSAGYFCLCMDPPPLLCAKCFAQHLRDSPEGSHYKVPAEALDIVQSVWDIPTYLDQKRKNEVLIPPLCEMIKKLQELQKLP